MLIVLDRDGVINYESKNFIKTPDEWIPIPGSIDAIATLSKAKYKIVIATNQSGVHRGLFSEKTLSAIHEKMLQLIRAQGGTVEKIYYCPHMPEENCACRKPKPGMLEKIHADFGVPFSEMIFVGDSERDFLAAKAVGCQFAWVRTGNMEHPPTSEYPVFDDLSHFAHVFLKTNS